MASTYTSLQADIASLLHRTDLTSDITGFISRAEARLNRALKLRTSETEATLAGVVSSRFVALPSDFNGAIALWIVQDSEREMLPSRLPKDLGIRATSGTPEEWAIDGSNLAFDKPCDSAYTVYFRYYAKFELTVSAPTNWLLTNAPDLYLYASLLESAPFIRDDVRIATWKGYYDLALKELSDSEHINKAMVTLKTELAGFSRPGGTNILQG